MEIMETKKMNTTKHIQNLTFPIILFFLFLILPSNIYSQISIVVSSSSSVAADESQLKNIFAGNITSWDNGSKVILIDQPDTKTGKDFYDKFIGQSANKVRLKWTKLVLSGAAEAPKKVNSDSDVKKEVSANPSAVGYISSSALDSSVKEIFKIE